MTIEIAIFAAVMLGVIGGLFLEQARVFFETREKAKAEGGTGLALTTGRGGVQMPTLDRSPTQLLQQVTDARFSQRRLIDSNEEQIFHALEAIIAEQDRDWRVMAQVNLADIVDSADPQAVAAIGDQRVAMLIVSAAQMPLAAVEYQPLGQIRDDSTLRAAIRREALRRADVDYIEVRANDTPDVLREQLRRLAARVEAMGNAPPIIAAATEALPMPRDAAIKPANKVPRKAAAKAKSKPIGEA